MGTYGSEAPLQSADRRHQEAKDAWPSDKHFPTELFAPIYKHLGRADRQTLYRTAKTFQQNAMIPWSARLTVPAHEEDVCALIAGCTERPLKYLEVPYPMHLVRDLDRLMDCEDARRVLRNVEAMKLGVSVGA